MIEDFRYEIHGRQIIKGTRCLGYGKLVYEKHLPVYECIRIFCGYHYILILKHYF